MIKRTVHVQAERGTALDYNDIRQARELAEASGSADSADSLPVLSASALALAELPALRDVAAIAVSSARALTVTDSSSYVSAADLVLALKRADARVHELLDPAIKEKWDAHREATTERAGYLNPLAEALTIADGKLRAWEAAERKRQTEEAERQARLAAEAAAEAKLAAAQELFAAGDEESARGAEMLVEEVTSPAPALVLPPVRTVLPESGVTRRTIKRYRLLDASKVKREFTIPNDAAIAALVTKMGEAAVAVVGEGSIAVYDDYSAPSVRKGKGVGALIKGPQE